MQLTSQQICRSIEPRHGPTRNTISMPFYVRPERCCSSSAKPDLSGPRVAFQLLVAIREYFSRLLSA
eukprot:957872-Prorocentrum_minimum.AAC.5